MLGCFLELPLIVTFAGRGSTFLIFVKVERLFFEKQNKKVTYKHKKNTVFVLLFLFAFLFAFFVFFCLRKQIKHKSIIFVFYVSFSDFFVYFCFV